MNQFFSMQGAVLQLKQGLSVNHASELHEELSHFFNTEEKDFTINASTLKKTDGAIMQLLASFAIEMSERKLSLKWQDPSAEFLKSARIMGLDKAMTLA